MLVALLSILLIIALDQGIKYWALHVLSQMDTIPLWNGVFHLTYVENRGAAFSILQNQRWLLIVISVVILFGILFALSKGLIHTTLGRWSLYMIAGGAIGNLLDRIFRGFVVDLFDFRLINFAVFNVADVFICVGGFLFACYIIVQHDQQDKVAQDGANPTVSE